MEAITDNNIEYLAERTDDIIELRLTSIFTSIYNPADTSIGTPWPHLQKESSEEALKSFGFHYSLRKVETDKDDIIYKHTRLPLTIAESVIVIKKH